MKDFLKRWVITMLAVLVAAKIVPEIEYTPSDLIVATLLLGILNAVVRPIMVILSLPLLIFTLGLFMLVINAILLYCVGHLINGFKVPTFSAAFWGALIISIISLLLNSLTKSGDSRLEIHRRKPPPPPPPPPGQGPVIDV